MKIIKQPLGGGCDCFSFSDGFDEVAISTDQLSAIVFKARQQAGAALLPDYFVLGGEFASVLLEPIGAEQFTANGFVLAVKRRIRFFRS
jgi:hypothetical protein